MEKVIVKTLCDLCYKIDDAEIERDADNTEFVTIGGKIYRLTWCDDHDGKSYTLKDMLTFFQKYGEKVAAPGKGSSSVVANATEPNTGAASTRRYPCPHCDKVYRRSDYIERHLADAHGIGDAGSYQACCAYPGCRKQYEAQRSMPFHARTAHDLLSTNYKKNKDERTSPAQVKRHNVAILRKAWAEYSKAS